MTDCGECEEEEGEEGGEPAECCVCLENANNVMVLKTRGCGHPVCAKCMLK